MPPVTDFIDSYYKLKKDIPLRSESTTGEAGGHEPSWERASIAWRSDEGFASKETKLRREVDEALVKGNPAHEIAQLQAAWQDGFPPKT